MSLNSFLWCMCNWFCRPSSWATTFWLYWPLSSCYDRPSINQTLSTYIQILSTFNSNFTSNLEITFVCSSFPFSPPSTYSLGETDAVPCCFSFFKKPFNFICEQQGWKEGGSAGFCRAPGLFWCTYYKSFDSDQVLRSLLRKKKNWIEIKKCLVDHINTKGSGL